MKDRGLDYQNLNLLLLKAEAKPRTMFAGAGRRVQKQWIVTSTRKQRRDKIQQS